MSSKLTTATIAPAPHVDRAKFGYGGSSATIYQVTPGKGARISGLVEAFVSTPHTTDYDSYGETGRFGPIRKRTTATRSTITIASIHERGSEVNRDPLIINGKPVPSRTSIRLEFHPESLAGSRYTGTWTAANFSAQAIEQSEMTEGESFHLSATVLGERGHWVRADRYVDDGLTPAASKVFGELANTIALDFVTDAKCAAALLERAQLEFDAEERRVSIAQAALDAQHGELASLTEHLTPFLKGA